MDMTALDATGQERGLAPRSDSHADSGLTIAHRLEHLALVDPDRRAFSFLEDRPDASGVDTRTWAQLAAGARAVAAVLSQLPRTGNQPRALLLLPNDATFLDALFGCFYAGVCAVPAHVPIPSRLEQTLPRLLAIVADARPDVVLTTRQILPARELVPALAEIPCIAVDDLDLAHGAPASAPESTVTLEDLAILQYSSGSSGTPRGVMVSHANLMANEAMIEDSFGHTSSTVALGWLPFQHDMGLIGYVIQPVYVGFECVLMSPLQFLKHPLRWLHEIADHRATRSGGPNFAYDMCIAAVERHGEESLAGLDLSSWDLAFVGAEPVRAATLDRFAATFAKFGFRREAFYPCYGLAEATLIVSGGRRDEPPTVWHDPNGRARVSCGRARLDTKLAIVDRAQSARCDDGVEGEIWVHGPSVAGGYFGDEQASRETFSAALDGAKWLRTGDLGCIVDGELYITGRAKDVVVKNGVNYAAEDLETTVQQLHLGPLHPNGCAAFSHDDGLRERLVIVSEIARDAEAEWSQVADQIVAAVATAHGTPADSVVFVNRGGIPRTTSGKIRRSECRGLYSRGELVEVHRHVTEGHP
jgi:acyl-CoA synthetase (AMP-forming)/AMP-acid ligase II